MKCNECNNANICLDHIELPDLQGCTSGIPDRKVTTNADRIRNMPDEELADILFDSCIDHIEVSSCERMFEKDSCKECVLKWLQSEASEAE